MQRLCLVIMGIFSILCLAATCVCAADGSWVATDDVNWGTAANWDAEVIADGAEFTADFNTLNITKDINVALDTGRTIGNLIFGDTTPSNHSWILAGDMLTFDHAGAGSTITVNDLGTGNAVLNLVIAGSENITKAGAGTLVLSGNNAYTGNTVINAGSIIATGNANAIGTAGSVILGNGATLTLRNDTGLDFGRNVTITGDATINSDTLAPAGVVHSLGDLAIGAHTLTVGLASTANAGEQELAFNDVTLTGNAVIAAVDGGAGADAFLVLGPVALDTYTLTMGGTAETLIDGVISGTGGLVKAGTGTLVLEANNTYSGTTTISDGTLQIGDGGTTGSLGTGAVTNNANLVVNRSNDLTIANVISGTGGLQKQGAGTLTLGGENTYAGATEINAGSVQFNESLVNSALVFSGNGTAAFADTKSISQAVTNTSGAAAGTLTLQGDATISGQVGAAGIGSLGAINAGATDKTVTFAADIYATSLNVTGLGDVNLNGSLNGNLAYLADGEVILAGSKNINGAITTTTDGRGMLTLSGASIVSGQVGSASLAISEINAGAAGTSRFSSDVFADNLNITGIDNVALDGSLTGNINYASDGRVILADTKNITGSIATTGVGSGLLALSGTSTVSGQIGSGTNALQAINAAANTKTATFSSDIFADYVNIVGTGTAIFNGTVTGTGVSFSGDGTVQLANNSNIVAAVTNDTGADGAGSVEILGNTSINGPVGGAGANERFGTLEVQGTSETSAQIAGAVTATELVLEGGNLLFGSDANITTTSLKAGGIAGAGELTSGTVNKDTAGTVQLAGIVNAATANINAGKLEMAGALNLSSDMTVASGAIFNLGTEGPGTPAITGAGTPALTVNGVGGYNVDYSVNYSNLQVSLVIDDILSAGTGGLVIDPGIVDLAGLKAAGNISGMGAVTVDGGLFMMQGETFGSTGLTIENDGLGLVSIASGTFAPGSTVINDGTLAIVSSGGTMNFGSTTVTGGDIFAMNAGGSVSFGNLTVRDDASVNVDAPVTVGGNLVITPVVATNAAQVNVNSNLSVNGAGGTTIGDGGTLRVNGILTSDNGVFVSDGGTLLGAGALVGNVTGQSGGLINPGNSIGTLSITGDFSLLADSELNIDVQPSPLLSDKLVVSGSATLASGSRILVDQFGAGSFSGDGSETFTIIETGGGVTDAGAIIRSAIPTIRFTGAIDSTDYILTAFLRDSIKWEGTTGNWSDPTQWDNSLAMPQDVAGNILEFTGAGGTSTANDGPYSNIGGLQFSDGAGAYTITGGSLSFGQDSTAIANLSTSTQTIENALAAGSGGLIANAHAGDLVLAGTISLASGGDLTVTGGQDTTVSNIISGSGELTKQGEGTLILSANNTYAGTTTISTGVLQVGNGGASGTLGTGAISFEGIAGTLLFDRTGDFEVANTITGFGDLIHDGSGTLTLSGTNTFHGHAIVNSGTLALSGGSAIGDHGRIELSNAGEATLLLNANETIGSLTDSDIAGTWSTVNLQGNTLTVGANNATTVFSGGIIGTGGLTKVGSGTLILQVGAENTYTGETVIQDGTLKLYKQDGTNAISGDVTVAGGTLQWDNSNQIDDSASITMTSGTVNLNGKTETITAFTNNGGTFTTGDGGYLIGGGAGGPTTITWAGGTNTINDGGIVEDDHVVITGGTNTVEGGTTGGMLKVTAGSTGLEMTGATLTLNSDATEAGKLLLQSDVTTSASATTSRIASGGSAAHAGTIDLDGGTRVFNVADGAAATDLEITAVIANGGLTKDGEGTLALSGANTYTDTTSVNAGTLRLNESLVSSALSFTGDSVVEVAAGKNIGQAVTTTAANQGTLTFLGDTTTGATIGGVGAALKEINFSGGTANIGHNLFAADTNVKDGATLSVTGDRTITGNVNVSGAASAVSLGTNTLTVTGDYVQTEGTLQLTIASTSSFGSISAVSAAVSGSIEVTVTGTLALGDTFKIVDVGGAEVTGTQVVSTSYILGFEADGTEDLILTAIRKQAYDDVPDGNAAAVGQVLEDLRASATGDMADVLAALDGLSTQAELEAALNTFTPVTDGGIVTVSAAMGNQIVGTASQRLESLRAAGTSLAQGITYAEEREKQFDIWAQAFNHHARQDTRGDSLGYRAQVWGTVFGSDKTIEPWNMCLGISVGLAQSAVKTQAGRGKTDIDGYQFTLYGSTHEPTELYFMDGMISFGRNSYSSTRGITAGAIQRTAYANYAGNQMSTYLNSGFILDDGIIRIVPSASLEYMRLQVDAYTETNADALNLTVAGQNYERLVMGMGVSIEQPREWENMTITPGGRLAFRYDLMGDSPQTTATFAGGGASFATVGKSAEKGSYELGANLLVETQKDVKIVFDYSMGFRRSYFGHTGAVEFRYRF